MLFNTRGILLWAGCEVESIFLNIEAVNTHRERPQVSLNLAIVKGTSHSAVGFPEEGQLVNIIASVIRALGSTW